MDKKFLNKVVNQIVSETEIDYGMGEIQFPFSFNTSSLLAFTIDSFISRQIFSFHCKNVYGLNDDEIVYVWEEYKQIIKDKIENNG